MKIYIDQEDLRFQHLMYLLNKQYELTDNVEEADVIILGFKKTKIPNSTKNDVFVFSYHPIKSEKNYAFINSESFLQKNAYLTAIACINQLDLKNKKVVIYGNGRIGTYLKRIIKGDGLVIARHPRLDEFPLDSLFYTDADIIINTIPARIPVDIELLNKNVKIIDLASDPYGFDHDLFKQKGFDIQLLSSLPAKSFPTEAAYLIYEEVNKCLADIK